MKERHASKVHSLFSSKDTNSMCSHNSFFIRAQGRNRKREPPQSKETSKITIEVEIPSALAGLVIGHGASTLDRIKTSAGVFAYVHKVKKQEDEWTYVEVRGLRQQVRVLTLSLVDLVLDRLTTRLTS